MKVLVVDDETMICEWMQFCISQNPACQLVGIAHNGLEALELFEKEEPDLILTDIKMPVMDGLEATRRIRSMEREDCHTIPIVAMSANAFDDDLKKSVECGMNGHLSKPVEVDKLYSTLNQVLRSGTGFCQL